MGIELVHDKNPDVLGVGFDHVFDVSGKINFGTSWSHAGCDKGT